MYSLEHRAASQLDLWVEEFLCYQKYMRAIFHLRPPAAVTRACITVAEKEIELNVANEGEFICLTADALTTGIQNCHLAKVSIWLSDLNEPVVFKEIVQRQIHKRDPFYCLHDRFTSYVDEHAHSLDVLEIGSRVRRATRDQLMFRGIAKSYVGVDIIEGQNVDVVGDAHKLADLVNGRQFDLVYSHYAFEHLAMPWAVVSQINQVLRKGGHAYLVSNHSIGLHDLPWDFWRYSQSCWTALFNEQTGFKILASALGDPVRLIPLRYHYAFIDHEGGAGFQGSSVWAEKTDDCAPAWPVDSSIVLAKLSRPYPKEITD